MQLSLTTRVHPRNLGAKHPKFQTPLIMDLSFKLKIGPKFEGWFLKLGGVFYGVSIDEIWHEIDNRLLSLHFFSCILAFGL